uniref:Uncharacterized protein n=1 Tax=Arundo donax TaxID=35708 RepID=A0A0A9AG39_ARUDO
MNTQGPFLGILLRLSKRALSMGMTSLPISFFCPRL